MFLPLLLGISSLACVQAVSFANLCQLDLKQSNVDLNAFYPGLVGSKSLSILRYAGEWDDSGTTDTCAVVLAGCVTCNCGTKTALLIQAHGWTVKCIEVPAAVTAAQQRTVNTPEDEPEEEEEPVRADDQEVTGAPPAPSYRGLLNDILTNSPSNLALPLPPTPAPAPDATTTEDPLNALVRQRIDQYMEIFNDTEGLEMAPQARMSGSVDNVQPQQTVDEAAQETSTAASEETTKESASDDTNINPSADKLKAESTILDDATTDGTNRDESTKTNKAETTTVSPSGDEDDDDEEEFFELNADSKKKTDGDETATTKAVDETTVSPEFTSMFGQMSSWRSRYFVVLGFFLVFSIIFIIIIVVLYMKLKEARKNGKTGNVSPGPGDDDLRSPMVQNEQSFHFSDATLPR